MTTNVTCLQIPYSSYFTHLYFVDEEKSPPQPMEHQQRKTNMFYKYLWDQCFIISLLSWFKEHIHRLQLIEMKRTTVQLEVLWTFAVYLWYLRQLLVRNISLFAPLIVWMSLILMSFDYWICYYILWLAINYNCEHNMSWWFRLWLDIYFGYGLAL